MLTSPQIQSIISSITTNKGDFGNRNEDLLIPAVVLVLIVLFSLLPRLVLLINFLLRICGVLLMLSGAGLVGNGIWCLGENMSLLLVPTAKTTQIVTGKHSLHVRVCACGVVAVGMSVWMSCCVSDAAHDTEDHSPPLVLHTGIAFCGH